MARETHLADTYHRSIGSNGVAIASNWRLSASGTGLVVWTPDSGGGALSYGSNTNDISSHSAAGASPLVTRADHVHRGVRSVNGQFGNVVNPEDTSYVEVAAAGSTETVDCSAARTYDLTLSANLTLTLTGSVNNEAHYVTVAFRQDGTGGWTVTHPGSVVWADGAPTIDPAAGAVTWVNYVTFDGGTTWYGFPIGSAAVASLDDLTDVTITAPTEGDTLRLRSGFWVNEAFPSLSSHWEVLMTGSAPPEPVTTDDETDWLYAEV